MRVRGGPASGVADVSGRASALASMDWTDFAVPYRGPEHSIGRMEAEAEERIVAALREARASEALAHVAPGWFAFLRGHMQVAAFLAKDCHRVLERAGRLCPWPDVARCIELQGLTQERQAQTLVLHAVEIESTFGDMPIDEARRGWNSDPAWRGSREMLAQLAGVDDWAETVVAMNLCFEPLVGQLLRREFGIGAAIRHDDPITPPVGEAGQREWEWAREWTVALLRFLIVDPRHGPENLATIERWLAQWLPLARSAARDVASLAELLPRPADTVAALRRVEEDQLRLAADAGLVDLVA